MKRFSARLNPTLLKAFLKTLYLNQNDLKVGYIEWQDTKYKLQPNMELIQALEKENVVKSVISFQHYPNSERVAVAVVHREASTKINPLTIEW